MHASNLIFEPIDAPMALPELLIKRLPASIDPQSIIAWSEYDLDESRRYARQFCVLTETHLVLFESEIESIDLKDISTLSTEESVGSDRIILTLDDSSVRVLRYSRRCRRDMSRLKRLLERRID